MDRHLSRPAFLAGAAALAAAATGGHAAAAAPLLPVRLSLNPHFASYAPLFVAIDKGYFRDAGIDLQVTRYQTSANSQLPVLARGDLDITPVVAGPALFNQFAQGFAAKIVGSIAGTKRGYHDTSVLVVRKDVWDSGAVRKPADLRGKAVDGAFAGSPVALLTMHAILAGGLKLSDVTFTTKEASPADQYAALLNKAVEVQGTTEPTASAMEDKGVGVRWLSYKDVMPWYQETYFAASAPFLRDHPDVVERFLVAFLRGVRDVSVGGETWTTQLVGTMSKWTELSEADVRRVGGPPYFGANGTIDESALDRVERFWEEQGLVKQHVDVKEMIDGGPLARARRTLRLR